jgi:hypothetical protein
MRSRAVSSEVESPSRIVCLGWGSLILDARTLPLRDTEKVWSRDGPLLHLEFARHSIDGRITLVLCEGAEACHVLWSELAVDSLAAARSALCDREWRGADPEKVVGCWSRDNSGSSSEVERAVTSWALNRDISGVVWTKLRPKFDSVQRVPTCDEVIAHLRRLPPEKRLEAERYVRNAPEQIRTRYRGRIAAELGWTYDGTITDGYIR